MNVVGEDRRVAERTKLHEAVVGEDEIDELGHMNVRFYLVKALEASRALAEHVGLGREAVAERGGVLELRDAWTRHRAEQLVGARLEVHGGVLDVRADGLRVYHDLVNPAKGELAASFVQAFVLRDATTRAPMPLPEDVAARAAGATVDWPEHGRPRTIDLDTKPTAPALELVVERDLAMRKPRVIGDDECGEDGVFVANRYQELFWAGEPAQPRDNDSWLIDLEGGGQMGWATLESRGVLHALPRAGTRIQSFGAEVQLAAKTSYRHHWVFDVDSRELLCTSSIVNLAFDIGARRAIEIPERVRAGLERVFCPDLL